MVWWVSDGVDMYVSTDVLITKINVHSASSSVFGKKSFHSQIWEKSIQVNWKLKVETICRIWNWTKSVTKLAFVLEEAWKLMSWRCYSWSLNQLINSFVACNLSHHAGFVIRPRFIFTSLILLRGWNQGKAIYIYIPRYILLTHNLWTVFLLGF